MTENVELRVLNIFHLHDGHPVLAVEVTGTEMLPLLPSGPHELVLDGQSMGIVQVVNEMMLSHPSVSLPVRAVMLAARLDMPSGPVKGHMTLVPSPVPTPTP